MILRFWSPWSFLYIPTPTDEGKMEKHARADGHEAASGEVHTYCCITPTT